MSSYQLPSFIWPTVVMAVCAIAAWRGRSLERLAAGGLLAAWALTMVTYQQGRTTEWGILIVDVAFLALLVWIVLKSGRYWPILGAGFHLLAILTHVARMLDPTFGGWTYMTAGLIWAYLVAFVIGYAAWTATPYQTTSVDTAKPTGATRR